MAYFAKLHRHAELMGLPPHVRNNSVILSGTGGLSVAGRALHSYQYQIKYWLLFVFYCLLPDTLYWGLQRI